MESSLADGTPEPQKLNVNALMLTLSLSHGFAVCQSHAVISFAQRNACETRLSQQNYPQDLSAG